MPSGNHRLLTSVNARVEGLLHGVEVDQQQGVAGDGHELIPPHPVQAVPPLRLDTCRS
jgi:hypothetical protein